MAWIRCLPSSPARVRALFSPSSSWQGGHLILKCTSFLARLGVRLYAGDQNYGVYVNLPDRNNEEWHITHPTGNITGFLRGSLYATISDTSFITCKGPSGKQEKGKTAVRAILNYPDEVCTSLTTRQRATQCFGIDNLFFDACPTELDQGRPLCGRGRGLQV